MGTDLNRFKPDLDRLLKVGAVILAAGHGKRMNSDVPKVMLPVGGRPMVSYIIQTLRQLGFSKELMCLVVGFKKETVMDYFADGVTYVIQEPQLGTAHAAYVGMRILPKGVSAVLVVQGDDSAFYSAATLNNFIAAHQASEATISLLTINVADPRLLGRVIRNAAGEFIGVYEKEQITSAQEKITEVSTGAYCLEREWFELIFPSMPKIDGLNELGLPTALKMAREMGKKIQAVPLADPGEWFGINTVEELVEANRRKSAQAMK